MTESEADTKYLHKRNGWYHYPRHVPKHLRPFYKGKLVRVALKTKSLEVAKIRRNDLEQADTAYWAELTLSLDLEKAGQTMNIAHAKKRYEIAKARAMAAGFVYRPVDQLADPTQIEEIVRRLIVVEENTTSDNRLNPAVVDAVLGAVDEPKVTISEAMEIYKSKITVGDLLNKSNAQKKLWHTTKDRSLRYFVDVIGDISIDKITREQALEYFEFWNDQISPKDNDIKQKAPKTAARHFSDIRKLFTEYYRYIGDEDRPNPFRNLNFKDKHNKRSKVIPAFETDWVRKKILVRGALDGLSADLHLVVLMCIETGCRPGEIINLRPEDIRTYADVPHIAIPERDDRQVKTQDSVREIPLVGVSLEAAKRAADGFPHYHDKTNSFSAAANAALRRRGLFPTRGHVIYSFRHAFEKRMQEANIDYALRCLLMGHKHNRPKYGDGGSLAYRQAELMKIVHPVPNDLFRDFDEMNAS